MALPQHFANSDRRRPRFAAVIVGLLLLSTTGCYVEPPIIFNPGDLKYQRTRAGRYDPFPDPQAGPAIPEARPREYANPPPEASRSRWEKPPPS